VKFQINKPIRLIELFGGIGLQALSLKKEGVLFEHHRLCEVDKFAVTSYNAIHGTNFTPSNIQDWEGSDLGIIDTDRYIYIVTYSFPCQSLSVSGDATGMDEGSNTRSSLLWEVIRLLKETPQLPQVLVMENVTQVHEQRNYENWVRLLFVLTQLGYTNHYADLNSKDYGVPQDRNRTFMVSLLGDYEYSFPKPIALTEVLKDRLEQNADSKYYLPIEAFESLSIKSQGIESRSIKQKSLFGLPSAPKNNIGNIVESAKRFRLPEIQVVGRVNHGAYANLHDIARRVYSENGISPTMHTCGGGNLEPLVYIEAEQRIRKITERESWRLMGISDEDYDKAKSALNQTYYNGRDRSSSQLRKQSGNGLCISVLAEIFRQML